LSDKAGRVDDLSHGKKSEDQHANARDEAQREAKKLLDADRKMRSIHAQSARDSGKPRSEISERFGGVELIEHTADGKVIPHVKGLDTNRALSPEQHLVKVTNVQEPVNAPVLKDSQGQVTSAADHLLAAEASYNCHFYTATVVLGHEPKGLFPIPKDIFNVSHNFPNAHGYRQSDFCDSNTFSAHKTNLQPGDVILVQDSNDTGATSVTHSAVVIKGGAEPIIRQKFDPSQPVVDLNAKQFSRAYLEQSPMEIYVWRK